MNDLLSIICGDALTELRKLPDELVQCCVTSPPFWGLRDYGCDGQLGLEKTPEEYVAKLVEVLREVHRLLRKDGTLWLNLGDSYSSGGRNSYDKSLVSRTSGVQNNSAGIGRSTPSWAKPKDLLGIPWRMAFALQTDGWWLRCDIIWNKANCMPESVRDRPTRSHEYIFLLTKSQRYFYNADAIKEPASESDWESRIGRANLNNKLLPTGEINGIRPRVKYTPNSKHAVEDNHHGQNQRRFESGSFSNDKKQRGHSRRHAGNLDVGTKSEQCSGMRNKRDVWTVAPANYPEAHFATYPPDLIKPCILAGSRVGDTVLDPFAGSGTTGEVALELGRKAILIELNPKYIAFIKERCDVTPGLALA